MSSRRLRVLRVIEELGPLSAEEVRLFLGQPEPGSIVAELTSLERQGLLFYSFTTQRYRLTKKAHMRRKKDRPTDSPTADTSTIRIGDAASGGEQDPALVVGAGSTPTEAGAASSPAPASVASLERAREALILDFEGPLGFALWVLRNEPDLYEGLALAAEQGMAVPDLIEVPRYRRAALVAEAVETHESRKAGGPCGACGAVVAPRSRWASGGYLSSEEPAFHPRKASGGDGIAALCSWCHDFLGEGHTLDELREKVGNAIGGVAASPGPGFHYRFAFRSLIPFFAETTGVAPGLPWAHITEVQRRAIEMLTEKTVHPRRLITTDGEADRASLPGLPARVHPAPHRGECVAPVVLRPEGLTAREEAEAMERSHAAERAQYLDEHPRAFDHQGREVPWAGADGWTALLDRHDRERKTPSLWRDRVGDVTPPPVERPAYQPPTVHNRRPTPEALLTARQNSEREHYLAQHPRPVQSSEKGPWKGVAGWTALLARHEQEQRALASTREAELRAMEQRHAIAREDYLSRNPRPRRDGIAWTGADGWASLLAAQETERKRLTGSALATATA